MGSPLHLERCVHHGAVNMASLPRPNPLPQPPGRRGGEHTVVGTYASWVTSMCVSTLYSWGFLFCPWFGGGEPPGQRENLPNRGMVLLRICLHMCACSLMGWGGRESESVVENTQQLRGLKPSNRHRRFMNNTCQNRLFHMFLASNLCSLYARVRCSEVEF